MLGLGDGAGDGEGGGVRGGSGGGGGGRGKDFQGVEVSRNIKYSSCEIEDLVETHRCKLVLCNTPIARITHICRCLLYAWC